MLHQWSNSLFFRSVSAIFNVKTYLSEYCKVKSFYSAASQLAHQRKCQLNFRIPSLWCWQSFLAKLFNFWHSRRLLRLTLVEELQCSTGEGFVDHWILNNCWVNSKASGQGVDAGMDISVASNLYILRGQHSHWTFSVQSVSYSWGFTNEYLRNLWRSSMLLLGIPVVDVMLTLYLLHNLQ